MRVAMISKACIVGAYQKKLEELARLPDVTLTVFVPPSWRDSRGLTRLERSHTAGYDLQVVPMALNGHFHLHWYVGLGPRLRALRPDIVHIDEEPYNLATWQAMRLASALDARACFFAWQNLARAYPLPFRWFERYNFRHAAHALAGSTAAADVLRRKGYTGPIAIVPQFGVDQEQYRPGEKPEPAGVFVIGYAGGLVPEKGIDVLLRAAAGLAGSWEVRLAGEGAEGPRLARLAQELGIAGRVHFLGRVAPSTAMPGFYRGLDIFVLSSRSQPSWIEQFGRVLVEAMACGVAVVGSTCGEIPQVIGDAGLIFPEGDVEALRAHLARLQDDTALRAGLAARGRARVLAHYTQARVAANTHAVYRQMVG
ncbi:MAG: glycosyltransferase family 4 protein [Anaerolineae bacterium]|nr:glycosyltransferase family 4 protein [Anaerolineae bacterium]